MILLEPVLCYVDGDRAYFTTCPLDRQWGDDWDDAPYEHNAGSPYDWHEGMAECGIDKYEITKLYFDGGLSTPSENYQNSPWSVQQINRGAVAWLFDRWGTSGVSIHAGTTISDFKRLVAKAGGSTYSKDTENQECSTQ